VRSQLLKDAATRLGGRSDSPRADAEILLAHVLGSTRAALLACDEQAVPDESRARFDQLLLRRARGEPVAYLTGVRSFWSLELEVTPDVLVPRPETELLVEWGLHCLETPSRAVDLGTGSGAIALALAKERPAVEMLATDVSAPALAIARANAARLGLRNVEFRHGDLFGPLAGSAFDLIVSNPPYVAEGDPHLADLKFEPAIALTSGADGLDALRTIVAGAPGHLRSGGWLLVEHGATQGPAVRELFGAAGFGAIETRRDLAGLERATGGKKA